MVRGSVGGLVLSHLASSRLTRPLIAFPSSPAEAGSVPAGHGSPAKEPQVSAHRSRRCLLPASQSCPPVTGTGERTEDTAARDRGHRCEGQGTPLRGWSVVVLVSGKNCPSPSDVQVFRQISVQKVSEFVLCPKVVRRLALL